MKCEKCGHINTKKDPTPEGFSVFWKVYPRKVGKGLAEKVWAKIKPDFELFSMICEAVENQKKSEQWQKDNGVYIPHPSTWLNQRRWEDETQKVKEEPKFDAKRMEEKKAEIERWREKERLRIEALRESKNTGIPGI